MYFFVSPGHCFNNRVGQETGGDSIGNTEGEGHKQHSDEGGEGLGEIVKVDIGYSTHHEDTDNYQCRSGSAAGNEAG